MQENNYLPLFRKYRPQSFKDVIGQEFTVTALQNAIKLNKIANAYLFCGPRGTGKTSCARIFAKSLNCKEGPTIDPCQKCQSCLDVTNAAGLDVIEIDAATNRGIDDAKELINKVQYAPMNGKYKIFIIDEVHMLSKEAFNALLKTFEEPPANVIFILATTEPHKVIETIVSRCQRFDFRRITLEDIVGRLRAISDIEKINITDEALFTIAKNVSGGMRDSLALLDQASVLGLNGQITKETIEMLTGKLTFDTLFSLTETILGGDVNLCVSMVQKIYENGAEPRNFTENFIEFLRNTVLVLGAKNVQDVKSFTLFEDGAIEKIKTSPLFEQRRIIYVLDRAVEFYKEIKVSTNPYLWAEIMVISAASGEISTQNDVQKNSGGVFAQTAKSTPFVQVTTPAQTARSIASIEPAQASAPVVPPAQSAQNSVPAEPAQKFETPAPVAEFPQIKAAPEQTSELDPAKVWTEILNKVDSIPAKFFYSGVGKLVGIQNTRITLGFVNQNAIAQAKSANKYNPLMKAIAAVLGENGSIDFITVGENTKIIETKISVKTSPAPVQNRQYEHAEASYAKPAFNNSASEPDRSKKYEKKEIQEEKVDTTGCTPITKEMLETFNGRLIE